jgi:hypothetical protein
MGLRIDNEFPGKIKAIANEPSDVIVTCHLLGSHSDDHGHMTTISNVPDFYLHLLNIFSCLSRVGLLKPTLRSVLNLLSHADGATYDDIDGFVLDKWIEKKPDVQEVMVKVDCSCGELFRFYKNEHTFTPQERRFFEAHAHLGHTVLRKHMIFTGRGWDITEIEALTKSTDSADFWGPEDYVPYVIHNKFCGRCQMLADNLYKHYRCIHGSDCDPREHGGHLRPEDREVVYVCFKCDHETMNGDDLDDDAGDVLQEREEREYEEDPINNDPPAGYQVR